MAIEIRTIREDELEAFIRSMSVAFLDHITGDRIGEQLARIWDVNRTRAAFDGDAIVGAAGAYSFEMTTPGGVVATSGLTAVGVLPTHRRRGILTRLVTRHLEEARAARAGVRGGFRHSG